MLSIITKVQVALARAFDEEEGQGLTEYALILALMPSSHRGPDAARARCPTSSAPLRTASDDCDGVASHGTRTPNLSLR